jgi:ABC-type nitrate/sulfonate/bicarbonate transport system permease component
VGRQGEPVVSAVALPGRRSRARRVVSPVATFLLTVGILIVLWVVFLRIVDVGSYVGKSPLDVWRYLTDAEMGAERRGELWDATGITVIQAFAGFVIGTLIACLVAVVFVLSRTIERAVMPIALALRSVPIVP